VSNLATLKFNQASTVGPLTVAGTLEQGLVTITSVTNIVFSDGATLKVNGTPTLDSYTLVEGSSVTGTPPTYDGADGYELKNENNSIKLVKTVVVTGSTFATSYDPGSEETVGPNGLKNLMNYALGGTKLNPSPELPVLTSDANGLTLTANIRNDDKSLTVVGQYAYSLESDWYDIDLTSSPIPNALSTTLTTMSFTPPGQQNQPRMFLRFQVK
jgi:hypothetical protein